MDVDDSVRKGFVVHFFANVAVALVLLLAPEEVLPFLGWTVVDPITPRLLGAALMGVGIQSFLNRWGVGTSLGRWDLYLERPTLLSLTIVSSVTAIVGLVLAIRHGAPVVVFPLLA